MSSGETDTAQSFWGHLDDLRSCLIKIGIVVIVLGIAAFLFKEELFAVSSLRKKETSSPIGLSTR